MSEKSSCQLVKDVEVKGGGLHKFIVRPIPYPLNTNLPYPFTIKKPYYLWKPVGPIVSPITTPFGYPLLNFKNLEYSEYLILISKGNANEIVKIFFEAGKVDDAVNKIKSLTNSKKKPITVTILYNGSKKDDHKADTAEFNKLLSEINIEPKSFKFT